MLLDVHIREYRDDGQYADAWVSAVFFESSSDMGWITEAQWHRAAGQ